MNKKGKEGGSTWFNRRQTEIPLFKINKKKKSRRGECGAAGAGQGAHESSSFRACSQVLGAGLGRRGSPRGARRGEGRGSSRWGGPRRAALPSPAPPPARVHCAPVSPQPATMPRKKGAAWEEPSSGNGTARAGPRRRGGPAGRKRERPERCSSSSGGGSSGDEDGPELDGAPGGGKRAARPAAAGKAGGAAAVITEPEHTKERVVSGAGARAVGGCGGRGAAGSRPAPPPTPRGELGGAGPGLGEPGVRGHAGAVSLPRVRPFPSSLSPPLPASLPPGGGQPAGSCRLAPGL